MAERSTGAKTGVAHIAGIGGGAGRAKPASNKSPSRETGVGKPKATTRPRSSAPKRRASPSQRDSPPTTAPQIASPSPPAAKMLAEPAAADLPVLPLPTAAPSPQPAKHAKNRRSDPSPQTVLDAEVRRSRRYASFTAHGVTFEELDEELDSDDDVLLPLLRMSAAKRKLGESIDLCTTETLTQRRKRLENEIPLPKSEAGANNIKVCIRVRPFNARELELQSNPQPCVSMPSKTEVVLEAVPADAIEPGSTPQAMRKFEYDRAYWSMSPSDPNFSSQQTLMDELGQELKSNVLHGYNSCIFAYGQTGSGKTFSILGTDNPPEMKGLLPRIVESIFETVTQLNTGVESTDDPVCSCYLTYLEIYNEQLRDLLVPPGETSPKVVIMNSPTMGVIVQGIAEIPVFTKDDVINWMDMGTRARTVGQTCMNAQSSRSHCIFTLEIHRTTISEDDITSHLHSKFVSVDLAGSERQSKTHATGSSLKEGAKINQSLTNLAIVINKLAQASDKKGRPGADNAHVPFRNSKLTYVLQNPLSGNSKTVMMAAISPSPNNWEESLSTLNFARSVKKIKTSAAKNELSKESIMANLRREIEELKARQSKYDRLLLTADVEADSAPLKTFEETINKYGHDFETQLQIAQKHQLACAKALEDMGLNISDISGALGIKATTPQLVNVSHDPSLQGCLVYFLERGNRKIRIGSEKGSGGIVLQGLGITPCNAYIHNHDDLTLTLEPEEGRVIVNGRHITKENESYPLRNGDRLILGYSFCFRVAIPLALEDVAAQEREWHSLEQALLEVMPGDMEAYENCHLFAEQLQMRLGSSKAQAFLKQFQKLSTLVEEANAITTAVRPEDHLFFSVEVLTDLYKYVTEEPECVVRLTRHHSGAKRLRNVVKKSLLSKTRLSRLADQFRICRRRSSDGCDFTTIAVFHSEAFKVRLEHIREVYELFEAGRQLDLDRPEHDPWRDIPPWEVEHLDMREEADSQEEDESPVMGRLPTTDNANHKRRMAVSKSVSAEWPTTQTTQTTNRRMAVSQKLVARQLTPDNSTQLDDETPLSAIEAKSKHDEEKADWLACEMVYCTKIEALKQSETVSIRKIEALEQEILEMRRQMAVSDDNVIPKKELSGARIAPLERREDIVAAGVLDNALLDPCRATKLLECEWVAAAGALDKSLAADFMKKFRSRDDAVLSNSLLAPSSHAIGARGGLSERMTFPSRKAACMSSSAEPIAGAPPPTEPIAGVAAQRAEDFPGPRPPRIMGPPTSLLFRPNSMGRFNMLPSELGPSWSLVAPGGHSSPVPPGRPLVEACSLSSPVVPLRSVTAGSQSSSVAPLRSAVSGRHSSPVPPLRSLSPVTRMQSGPLQLTVLETAQQQFSPLTGVPRSLDRLSSPRPISPGGVGSGSPRTRSPGPVAVPWPQPTPSAVPAVPLGSVPLVVGSRGLQLVGSQSERRLVVSQPSLQQQLPQQVVQSAGRQAIPAAWCEPIASVPAGYL